MKKEVGYLQGDLSERVRRRLCGIESRLTSGYTTLLYFAEKVNTHVNNITTCNNYQYLWHINNLCDNVVMIDNVHTYIIIV